MEEGMLVSMVLESVCVGTAAPARVSRVSVSSEGAGEDLIRSSSSSVKEVGAGDDMVKKKKKEEMRRKGKKERMRAENMHVSLLNQIPVTSRD